MKSHPYATYAAAIAAACATIPAIAADISPNPHQVTRIIDSATDTTISGFANNGQLRKRGAGTLTLAAPGLNGSGELVVEEGSVVLDLDAATSVPTLPSTITVNIALWLDASRNVVTDGNGNVVDWFDCRETNPTAAGAHSKPFASSRHTWVSGATGGAPALVENDQDLDGMTYVDFGPRNEPFAGGKWLCLTNTSGSAVGLQEMVEAFVVFAKHPGNPANFRGVGTIFSGYYNGNRCNPWWAGATDKFWFSNQNTRADKGDTRLDRSPVWGGILPIDDTEFHVISTRVPLFQSNDASAKWNLLGADRDLASGGMRIAEVIAFPVRISEFDRMRVEDYLWRKWMGSRQTSVGMVSVNEGASATIDTDSDVSGDLTGGGAVVKTGDGTLNVPARDFSGTVELRQGGVRTVGAAFAVPAAGKAFTATAASVVSATATNAGLVVKNGYGPMSIASISADTETLRVERGTLRLSPPAQNSVPSAAVFPNADFEVFAGRFSDYVNIGGGSGTTSPQSSSGWTFDRVGRTANNAVCIVTNSQGTGTFAIQPRDHLGLGYDGAVSLLLCQGKATGTFSLPASGLYKASFRIAGYNTARFDAQILIDDVQRAEFTAITSVSFTRYEVALPFLSAGEHTFTISDVQPTQTNRILFDDVKILPVEARDATPVSVAIANPSFELPWTNLADAYDNLSYAPAPANCTGWTFSNEASSNPWAGQMLRRRWFNGMPIDSNGLCTNPEEMPDGFLCAQICGAFTISQDVTFPSAGRYRLRFHLAKRCLTSPQTVTVSVGGTVVRKVIVRHDEFRRYEAVFDVAEAGSQTLQFAGGKIAENGIVHTAGCALLDAISCERVSDIPSNLVSNGGFESGMTGWTREGYLNVVSAFISANWADGIEQTPLQGADSLAFAIDGPVATLRQDVTFPAAGRYVLSFRFQAFDAHPDLLTSVHRFWVRVGDDRILLQTMLADDRERLVTQPFTVQEAGTKTLEIGFERWMNPSGCKANVIIDDVSIVAAPAADRSDLARFIPNSLEVEVMDTDQFGTVLNLDFDGEAKVAKLVRNGRKVLGEISHAICPEWVMGRGRLRADPKPFTLVLR